MKAFTFFVVFSIFWISSEAKVAKKSPERRVSRHLKKTKSAKALDYHSITIEEIKASKKKGSGKGGKNKNWKGDGYGNEPPNPLGKGKSSKSTKSSLKCNSGSGKGKGGYINCNTASPTVTSAPSLKPSVSLSPSIAPTTSSAPTSFPTIEFDLQVCRSYAQIWLRDLTETCIDNTSFEGCQCRHAEKKIESGDIDCETAVCPPDCSLCDFCLTTLLNCVQPQSLTKAPTMAPNAAFNLQQCESYSDTWTTEIAVDGNCKSAHALIEDGIIDCEVDQCPDDCEVCSFCLESLYCKPTPVASPTSSPSMAFDLQQCASYSDTWSTEIIVDGNCKSAHTLIEDGIIDCEVDQCPDDCEVCSVCLASLYCKPTPVASPSLSPSHSPTDTKLNFNLSQCDTYQDIWTTDVLVDGICKDAQERITNEEINCETSTCPENCNICQQCLTSLNCATGMSLTEENTTATAATAPVSKSFALSICSTYKDTWFAEFMTTSHCISAQSLISSGVINCSTDKCPDDCDMCTICMNQLNCSPTTA